MKHATSQPISSARRIRNCSPTGTTARTTDTYSPNRYSPSRGPALLVVALFALQLSRFYMAIDVMPLICPHHTQRMDMEMDMGMMRAGSASQNHRMAMAHPSGTQPANDAPVCRCCCRYSWAGLMTIVVLDTPTDSVKAPLFDGARRVSFAAKVSHPENDLSPPVQPPRV
jgi:hypothetical protein